MNRCLLPLFLIAVFVVAGCAAVERPRFGPGPPGIVAPSQFKSLSAAPVKGDAAVFAFNRMRGAPAEMLFALEDMIEEEAAARKINLAEPDDPSVTYLVQGYISTVGDLHSVLLVYVWDVFDRFGTRIHRFSGQETAPGSGSDPWSGVTREVMGSAARDTLDAMAEWIRE
ncbi:MAG: hypothetical protein ACTSP2_03455 [Alphaproteobacteria bacterium]